jgi:hypothetical protein
VESSDREALRELADRIQEVAASGSDETVRVLLATSRVLLGTELMELVTLTRHALTEMCQNDAVMEFLAGVALEAEGDFTLAHIIEDALQHYAEFKAQYPEMGLG